jgi:hypothetical protein
MVLTPLDRDGVLEDQPQEVIGDNREHLNHLADQMNKSVCLVMLPERLYGRL